MVGAGSKNAVFDSGSAIDFAEPEGGVLAAPESLIWSDWVADRHEIDNALAFFAC